VGSFLTALVQVPYHTSVEVGLAISSNANSAIEMASWVIIVVAIPPRLLTPRVLSSQPIRVTPFSQIETHGLPVYHAVYSIDALWHASPSLRIARWNPSIRKKKIFLFTAWSGTTTLITRGCDLPYSFSTCGLTQAFVAFFWRGVVIPTCSLGMYKCHDYWPCHQNHGIPCCSHT